MKILMIGGTRFIGAHVARRLHDAGHEIAAFHRGTSNNPVLPDIEHVLDASGPEDNGDLATVYGFAAAPDWRWTHAHVANVAAAIAAGATHPDAGNAIFNVGEESTPTMG